MFRNKTFILVLCAALFLALAVLMYFEIKNPELGSALFDALKEQVLPSAKQAAAAPKG